MTDDVGKLVERLRHLLHECERARGHDANTISQPELPKARANLENWLVSDGAGEQILSALAANSRLTEIDGWKRTALAMRDASIEWSQDGKNRCDEIQRLYFDAAMFKQFSSE